MGYTFYSSHDRSLRASSLGYHTKSTHEIFKQREINNAMSPFNVGIRESRDSDEHPESLAIIIALDVTGSMGSVPHFLVKDGLPNIMEKIMKSGIPDPQILFLGIGDHEVDSAPLQVGQFESGDELLDKWLTDVWLEGGGGGNAGESYFLAWYFAAYHTSIDCFEKRKQKGFLFTIGDEPVLRNITSRELKHIMGDGQFENFSASQLYDKAREMYNVFHINIAETSSGSRLMVMDGWKQLLSDNLKIAERRNMVSDIIADTIISHMRGNTMASPAPPEEPAEDKPGQEMIL